MKEIGGYFGLDNLISNKGEHYPDLIALNTARNALVYIAKARSIEKVYLPYMLCDSVSLVCERERISYEFYHIDEQFQPIFDKELDAHEYLYVVNLYGQFTNERITRLKQQYGQIIIDNTHSFFQKPVDGIDTIYSCRKFFGVPDGAYLATDCLLDEDLLLDKSDNRTKHIYGRINDGATAHYAEFKSNDESFKQLPLMKMSKLTHEMLSAIDYERVKAIREENFAYLHEHLRSLNKLELYVSEGAFSYPFYCENGMEIKKRLAKNKIYVATLWPNVLSLDEIIEKDYAENILPLPCDQRYDVGAMKNMLTELHKYIE